ncbi:hypothetical protein AB0E69_14490 [Kribbella sp. NPDC026611]
MIGLLGLVTLVWWRLNRNQRKQLRGRTNGVPDRDLERLVAELRAIS